MISIVSYRKLNIAGKLRGFPFFIFLYFRFLSFIGINWNSNLCYVQRGSQENVAAMIQLEGLDLTQKAISRMEAGKRLMTDYELKYLADALGVSIPELFENDPELYSTI